MAFAVEDAGEDLAARGEVHLAEIFVEHAFVGAQVHIGFHAVFEDEDLAVAEGIERAGVEVEVAFHFDRGDLEPFVLENFGEGRGKDSLAEAGHDGADDDDVFGFAAHVALGHGRVKLGVVAGVSDGGQKFVFLVCHCILSMGDPAALGAAGAPTW